MTMTLMTMVMISRLARSSILLTTDFFSIAIMMKMVLVVVMLMMVLAGEDLTSSQVIELVDQRLLLDGDHRTLLQIASQPVNFITRTDLQVR